MFKKSAILVKREIEKLIEESITEQNRKIASQYDSDKLVIDTPEKEAGMLRLLGDIFEGGNND